MRSLKDNANIIKSFMVDGAVNFYFPYYLDGEKFIKQINVEKEDVENAIMLANETRLDYQNGLIDEHDVMVDFIKSISLSGLVELEKEEPTSNELTLYQYIADIIIGQPNIMFKLVSQVHEQGEIDDEAVEMAEFDVYYSIFQMFVALDKIAKIVRKEAC